MLPRRVAVAVALAIVACTRSQPTTVAPASELAIVPSGPPPMLVFVARDGAMSIASPPPAWRDLARFAARDARAIDGDALYRLLRDQFGFDWSPAQTMSHVDEFVAIARSAKTAPIDLDAISGASAPLPGPGVSIGRVVSGPSDLAKREPAIVIADPRASAASLIAALRSTNGLIGVAHDGAIAVLPLDLLPRGIAAGSDGGRVTVTARDAQALIDRIVAAHRAGATAISLGHEP